MVPQFNSLFIFIYFILKNSKVFSCHPPLTPTITNIKVVPYINKFSKRNEWKLFVSRREIVFSQKTHHTFILLSTVVVIVVERCVSYVLTSYTHTHINYKCWYKHSLVIFSFSTFLALSTTNITGLIYLFYTIIYHHQGTTLLVKMYLGVAFVEVEMNNKHKNV